MNSHYLTKIQIIIRYCFVWFFGCHPQIISSSFLIDHSFLCLACPSLFLFLSPCMSLDSKLYYLATYLLCLPIYLVSPSFRSSLFQAACILSLTPALGVWALTGSLRVTGAPCRYLPGLATLCAVVRES